MATKLKNLRLTSVDLVPRGANQEADICLYKSADDAESPTESEKNIFKRFIGWLRENPAEAEYEAENTVETEDETPADPADLYKSAIFESLQSILTDETLSDEDRGEMITKSIEEYHEAMVELFKNQAEPEETPAPVDSYVEDIEEIEEIEVEKFNPNHDASGRFASGGGGVRRRNIDEETDEILAIERELAGSKGGGSGAKREASGNKEQEEARAGLKRVQAELKSGVKDPKRRTFLEAAQRRYEKVLSNPGKYDDSDFDYYE